MRRPILLSAATLGAGLSLVATTGTWSVFQDTNVSDDVVAETGELGRAVDVEVAPIPLYSGVEACSALAESAWSSTGAVGSSVTFTDLEGFSSSSVDYCVRNGGSTAAALSVGLADAVVDVEVTCGPDEGTVDDTCEAGGAGELSGFLEIASNLNGAAARYEQGPTNDLLIMDPGQSQPAVRYTFGSIAPDEIVVITLQIKLVGSDLTPEQRQTIQSDRSTWNWAFTLQTAP